jgi:hypothetical protein
LKHAFSRKAFLVSGLGVGIGQVANTPREWGQGPDGAAKRFGAVFGKHLVKSSVELTVAGLRDEDVKYEPSGGTGFGPRMKHALVRTVVVRRTSDGSQTMATGRVAGSFTSGFVSLLWLPPRLHTVSNGMASAGVSLGVDALTNVFREFWPDIRRGLGR